MGLPPILKLSFLLLTIPSQVPASLWVLLPLIASQTTLKPHQTPRSTSHPIPILWLLYSSVCIDLVLFYGFYSLFSGCNCTRLFFRLRSSLTEEGSRGISGKHCFLSEVSTKALSNLTDMSASPVFLFYCQRETVFLDISKATFYDLQVLDSLVIHSNNSSNFDF